MSITIRRRYPSDQYDLYHGAFTHCTISEAVREPARLVSVHRADSGDDIWLNLYVSKTDDITLLIEDMDGIGLFGTADPVSVIIGRRMC